MADLTSVFTDQFTPAPGGYLYYPSKRSGAKFVTTDEYEALLGNWQRSTGRKGMWSVVGLAVLVIIIEDILADALVLPRWSGEALIGVIVLAITMWFGWLISAPNRLVRDRPEMTSPRSASQVEREARNAVSWTYVVIVLLVSGVICAAQLSSWDGSLGGWIWTIGSGAIFAMYLWTVVQKLRDGNGEVP